MGMATYEDDDSVFCEHGYIEGCHHCRIAQLESQLAEAKATIATQAATIAELEARVGRQGKVALDREAYCKKLQTENAELKAENTALVEAARELLFGMGDYPTSLGQKWLVDSEDIDALAKLIGTKGCE